jgi:hypothetical protein
MKRYWLIVPTLGALIALSGLGVDANAACNQWDISGDWHLVQTNGADVSVKIQQDGQNLRGSADFWPGPKSGGGRIRGDLDGSIEGNDLEFTVYWSQAGDSIGVYKGSINPRGRMEGSTYDRMNPRSTAVWHSSNTGGLCADAAAASPPAQAPAPKPKTQNEKLLQGIRKPPKVFGTSPR